MERLVIKIKQQIDMYHNEIGLCGYTMFTILNLTINTIETWEGLPPMSLLELEKGNLHFEL